MALGLQHGQPPATLITCSLLQRCCVLGHPALPGCGLQTWLSRKMQRPPGAVQVRPVPQPGLQVRPDTAPWGDTPQSRPRLSEGGVIPMGYIRTGRATVLRSTGYRAGVLSVQLWALPLTSLRPQKATCTNQAAESSCLSGVPVSCHQTRFEPLFWLGLWWAGGSHPSFWTWGPWPAVPALASCLPLSPAHRLRPQGPRKRHRQPGSVTVFIPG